MTTGNRTLRRRSALLPHALAAIAALLYAWMISRSSYMTTGLQFLSPLAVVLLVHLTWLAIRRELHPGFAHVVFRRTLTTMISTLVLVGVTATIAPMPAVATSDIGELFRGALVVLMCVTMVVVVAGTFAALLYVLYRLVRFLVAWLRTRSGGPPGSDNSRARELGTIAVALMLIGFASLEGVVDVYSFATRNKQSASYAVAAPPHSVWQAVSTATSPDFALPAVFAIIPRPVAIIVDEGSSLGSRRIVRFWGREGVGDLSLRVTERTDAVAVYRVIKDTSPIANWVRHNSISFRVEPAPGGVRLTVTADYDRLLSPAWFFQPLVAFAASLAVDVLARDTKARAERF